MQLDKEQANLEMTIEQMIKGHPQIAELTPAHDEEALAFFNQVAMKGKFLSLYMLRNPRFFYLYEQRGGHFLTLGLRDYNGQLVGQGSVISTPCFIDKKLAHFGYLCDLRVHCPDRELRKDWKILFSKFIAEGPRLKAMGENCRLVTAVIDNNERARKLIEDHTYGAHRFLPIAHYSMVNVMGRWPWIRNKTKASKDFYVTRGGSLSEIEAFLTSVHREQAFGINYGAPDFVLRRNLESWKDFSLNDFYIVRNQQNKIIAATALWKTSHCKQTIVEGPSWAKAFNGVMKWLGLPQLGQPIEFLYLTHLTFDWSLTTEQKNAAFSLLFDSIWPEKKRRRAHAISYCDFKDYSVLSALSGYIKIETHLKLYLAVPEAEAQFFSKNSLGRFPPAFEMALA